MLKKLRAIVDVFEAGKAVGNPRLWKIGQLSANTVAALIFAVAQLLKLFGYDFGIDLDASSDIAVCFLAVANFIATVVSTKHIGFRKKEEKKDDVA